jgi:hypothetical protein
MRGSGAESSPGGCPILRAFVSREGWGIEQSETCLPHRIAFTALAILPTQPNNSKLKTKRTTDNFLSTPQNPGNPPNLLIKKEKENLKPCPEGFPQSRKLKAAPNSSAQPGRLPKRPGEEETL